MLRTIQVTRTDNEVLRIAGILFFTFLTAISAKISLEIGLPAPITMQPFVVLLAGMVLGARDGAASLLTYVMLIALGLPLDARGLGSAVFASPTAGYLIGFVGAAFVTGWLVERGATKVWQRWIAGLVGVLVIYAFGVPVLKLVTGLDWVAAFNAGAMPFIILDALKALVAAGLMEGGRAFLLRNSDVYLGDTDKKSA